MRLLTVLLRWTGCPAILGFWLGLAAGIAQADEVTIAAVTGLDKANAGNLFFVAGVIQAVRDLNAAGGLLGRTLRVQLEDNSSNAARAEAVAQRLIKIKPALVIGDTYSSALLASSPIYQAAGIVQISPSATNPLVTERGIPTLFRTIGRDDKQGEIAAAFIAEHWRGKRIAVLNDEGVYGDGLAKATLAGLHQRGIQETMTAEFPAAAADYNAITDMLARERIEAIYLASTNTSDAAHLTHDIRAHGIKAAIMGGDTLAATTFVDIAGHAADGVLFSASPDPRGLPANAALVERLRLAGGDPPLFTYLAYAAVQVWAEAVRKVGSFDGAAVAAELHRGHFSSVLGPIAFDAKGDIQGDGAGWKIYVWQGGAYEIWR